LLGYLIQSIQGSVASVIVLSLFFVAVHKQDDEALARFFRLGLWLGGGAAVVLALLKYLTVWIVTERWDMPLLAVSAAVGVVFLLTLWLRGRGSSQRKPVALLRCLSCLVLTMTLVVYFLRGVLLAPTGFTPPGMDILTVDVLFKLVGWLAGLAVVAIAAISLIKVSSKLEQRTQLVVFTLGLLINMVIQISTVAQYLVARGVVRLSSWLFQILVFTINYRDFFTYAILLVCLVLTVFLWIRNRRVVPDPALNPAQKRKVRALARSVKRWSVLLLFACVAVTLSLTVVRAYDERGIELSPVEDAQYVNGQVVIPLTQVEDGHLHRFAYYTEAGTEVRFIVIRKNETVYGVGLDACQICGETGYYERENEVVCRRCDVVMNKQTIGFTGGCNPIPIDFVVGNGQLTVEIAELESYEDIFGRGGGTHAAN
jgi:uncharacterized membrane protein